MIWKALSFVVSAALAAAVPAQACTRLVYLGAKGNVITARSMDFRTDIPTDLWILPRGVERNGETGKGALRWKAKYGSVVTSGFGISTTDGVNEAGLQANLLWLVNSQYPDFERSSKPGLAISLWAQYMLDNYPTVAEAVAALRSEPFTVVTDALPGRPGDLTTIHLSLSDSTGDSAIIEYVGGKQVIHHDRKYQVMTNDPLFSEQLALNAYWKEIGGSVMLPGTTRAADRFVRASFWVNAVPKDVPPNQAVASVFGIIRNVSTPYGYTTPESPNNSSTLWRVVFDHSRKLYFFESAFSPNTIWVDLKAIDFAPAAKTRMLDLGERQAHEYSGDVTRQFKEAAPFRFLGLPPERRR